MKSRVAKVFLAAVVLVFAATCAFAANPEWTESHYTLETSKDLAWFASEVNKGGESSNLSAVLASDIDLEGSEDDQWAPIGTSENPYKGTFDGNGYTISGLYIKAPGEHFQGLFGYIGDGAQIKNLTVSGDVTGKEDVGMIVGLSDSGVIEHCTALGTVKGVNDSKSLSIGGIAGRSQNGAAIKNCVSKCNVSEGNIVGGIVGTNMGTTKIEECTASGNVTSIKGGSAGGVAGNNLSEGEIRGCTSECDVKGGEAGGIVGTQAGNTTIADCKASGNVTGEGETAGGIVGNNTVQGKVDSSYSSATVNGEVANDENLVGTNTNEGKDAISNSGPVSPEGVPGTAVNPRVPSGSTAKTKIVMVPSSAVEKYSDDDLEYAAVDTGMSKENLTTNVDKYVTAEKKTIVEIAKTVYGDKAITEEDVNPFPVFKVRASKVYTGDITKDTAMISFSIKGSDFLATRPYKVKVLKVLGDAKGVPLEYYDESILSGDMEGKFVIQDMLGNILSSPIVQNKPYLLSVFIKDNGSYDLNKKDGQIVDPLAIISTDKAPYIGPEEAPEAPEKDIFEVTPPEVDGGKGQIEIMEMDPEKPMEYKHAGDDQWITCETNKIDVYPGTYYVRYAAKDDGTLASKSTPVEVPQYQSGGSTPAPTHPDEKTVLGGEGVITGTTEDMEYRSEGAEEWTTCEEDTTSLEPGTYYVRYAAKDGTPASESIKIEVKAPVKSSGSGGCNAGFAGILLLLALPLIAKKKD